MRRSPRSPQIFGARPRTPEAHQTWLRSKPTSALATLTIRRASSWPRSSLFACATLARFRIGFIASRMLAQAFSTFSMSWPRGPSVWNRECRSLLCQAAPDGTPIAKPAGVCAGREDAPAGRTRKTIDPPPSAETVLEEHSLLPEPDRRLPIDGHVCARDRPGRCCRRLPVPPPKDRVTDHQRPQLLTQLLIAY